MQPSRAGCWSVLWPDIPGRLFGAAPECCLGALQSRRSLRRGPRLSGYWRTARISPPPVDEFMRVSVLPLTLIVMAPVAALE